MNREIKDPNGHVRVVEVYVEGSKEYASAILYKEKDAFKGEKPGPIVRKGKLIPAWKRPE